MTYTKDGQTLSNGVLIGTVWQPMAWVLQLTDAELSEYGIVKVEPEPAPTPVEVVPNLNPRQIRFVLNQAGLREQVETLIAAADQTTKDYWEFSLEYEFAHPVLVGMANALGITEEQRKQMFIDGALL